MRFGARLKASNENFPTLLQLGCGWKFATESCQHSPFLSWSSRCGQQTHQLHHSSARSAVKAPNAKPAFKQGASANQLWKTISASAAFRLRNKGRSLIHASGFLSPVSTPNHIFFDKTGSWLSKKEILVHKPHCERTSCGRRLFLEI